MKTFKTRNRRTRAGKLPWGHVTTTQLKAEVERGIDYFWRRRPAALRPPETSFLDFRRA